MMTSTTDFTVNITKFRDLANRTDYHIDQLTETLARADEKLTNHHWDEATSGLDIQHFKGETKFYAERIKDETEKLMAILEEIKPLAKTILNTLLEDYAKNKLALQFFNDIWGRLIQKLSCLLPLTQLKKTIVGARNVAKYAGIDLPEIDLPAIDEEGLKGPCEEALKELCEEALKEPCEESLSVN